MALEYLCEDFLAYYKLRTGIVIFLNKICMVENRNKAKKTVSDLM